MESLPRDYRRVVSFNSIMLVLSFVFYPLQADAEPDTLHEENISDVFFIVEYFVDGTFAQGLSSTGAKTGKARVNRDVCPRLQHRGRPPHGRLRPLSPRQGQMWSPRGVCEAKEATPHQSPDTLPKIDGVLLHSMMPG